MYTISHNWLSVVLLCIVLFTGVLVGHFVWQPSTVTVTCTLAGSVNEQGTSGSTADMHEQYIQTCTPSSPPVQP